MGVGKALLMGGLGGVTGYATNRLEERRLALEEAMRMNVARFQDEQAIKRLDLQNQNALARDKQNAAERQAQIEYQDRLARERAATERGYQQKQVEDRREAMRKAVADNTKSWEVAEGPMQPGENRTGSEFDRAGAQYSLLAQGRPELAQLMVEPKQDATIAKAVLSDLQAQEKAIYSAMEDSYTMQPDQVASLNKRLSDIQAQRRQIMNQLGVTEEQEVPPVRAPSAYSGSGSADPIASLIKAQGGGGNKGENGDDTESGEPKVASSDRFWKNIDEGVQRTLEKARAKRIEPPSDDRSMESLEQELQSLWERPEFKSVAQEYRAQFSALRRQLPPDQYRERLVEMLQKTKALIR